jgi:hypothetical protein
MALQHFQSIGWQIGLTYMSNRAEGLNYDYLSHLLDEMKDNNMNLLSVMMQSYAWFDPVHDGYCWPVQNQNLECYKDIHAINCLKSTEYLSKVISLAAKKGIEIELFLNWGIWNHEKIIHKYPNSLLQLNLKGKQGGWLHCPDSPDAWKLGLDEVSDLLTFYNHSNVKRYAFERISYASNEYCHCDYTQKKFQQRSKLSNQAQKKDAFSKWKVQNIEKLLQNYVQHIKELRPDIKIGIHSQGKLGWGHDPATFKKIGIDYIEPHTIQFKTNKIQFYKMIKFLAPNDCILHFCARDIAPQNYPIWIKTPKIIKQVFHWIHDYQGDNIKGMLFFNEPAVSNTNKKAIYEEISKYQS